MTSSTSQIQCQFNNFLDLNDEKYKAINLFGLKSINSSTIKTHPEAVFPVQIKLVITSVSPQIVFYSIKTTNFLLKIYPKQNLMGYRIYPSFTNMQTNLSITSTTYCVQSSLDSLLCFIDSASVTISAFGYYSIKLVINNGSQNVPITTGSYIPILISDKPNITYLDHIAFINNDNPFITIKFDRNLISSSVVSSVLCRYKVTSFGAENIFITKLTEGVFYNPSTILCGKYQNNIIGDVICLDISFNKFHDYVSTCGLNNIILSRYLKITNISPLSNFHFLF